jgi:hypothetical protein
MPATSAEGDVRLDSVKCKLTHIAAASPRPACRFCSHAGQRPTLAPLLPVLLLLPLLLLFNEQLPWPEPRERFRAAFCYCWQSGTHRDRARDGMPRVLPSCCCWEGILAH